MREGRAAVFCFEGKEERANSEAAVCKDRVEFFALLAALLETRAMPRAVSIVVNDEDDGGGEEMRVEEILVSTRKFEFSFKFRTTRVRPCRLCKVMGRWAYIRVAGSENLRRTLQHSRPG